MITYGLVGCGPSLAGIDLKRFPANRVIALKEMLFDIPGAIGFGADTRWMFKRRLELAARGNVVLAVPKDGSKKYPQIVGATYIERRQGTGFCDEPDAVNMGGSTGYAGLNYVFHASPDRVLLFGYDYMTVEHFHHYNNERYGLQTVVIGVPLWDDWAKNFESAMPQLKEREIEVIVCGHTKIKGFKNISVDEGIEILCKSTSEVPRSS